MNTCDGNGKRKAADAFRPALLALVLALPVLSCGKAGTPPRNALEAVGRVKFSCGAGTREKVERWGFSGASRGCYREGRKDGRFIFWEEGYLNLEGFYSEGVKDGTWTVFNGDGSVFVEIVFDKGVKKSKTYR